MTINRNDKGAAQYGNQSPDADVGSQPKASDYYNPAKNNPKMKSSDKTRSGGEEFSKTSKR